MEIKEIYVEAKRSFNFQAYTVGFTANVNEDEVDVAIKELQQKARDKCQEEIDKDRGVRNGM